MAAAFFSPPRIRREKASSCRMKKNAPQFCLRFVSTLSHDVNVRRSPFLAIRLKRFTFHGI
jgi:hypothetical protein